jgi:hypothetical protein
LRGQRLFRLLARHLLSQSGDLRARFVRPLRLVNCLEQLDAARQRSARSFDKSLHYLT